MACGKVFVTAELCEGILRYLPIDDLLRAQGVCKRWEEIVAGSSVLQEQLFYRPSKSTTIWLVDIVNLPTGPRPIYNRHDNQMRVKAAVSPTSNDLKAHHGLVVRPVQPNPLFVLLEGRLGGPLDHRILSNDALVVRKGFRAVIDHSNGSWEDMFLTQPPVQYVTLDFDKGPAPTKEDREANELREGRHAARGTTSSRRHRENEKLYVESGIKMGDIANALRGRWIDSGFQRSCVIWLHGAIFPREGDDEFMRVRTRRWKDGLSDVDEPKSFPYAPQTDWYRLGD